MDILRNISLWAAFCAWMVAQFIKLLTTFVKTRQIDFGCFVSTGGMPSAHTAMVCALTMSIGLRAGFASPLFATTAAFAGIVMFDAQSVRRAAGQQARLLNQIVSELFRNHHFSQTHLVEFLGHTRFEVFVGMVLGIVIALGVHAFQP